jgi:hypothetical protein
MIASRAWMTIPVLALFAACGGDDAPDTTLRDGPMGAPPATTPATTPPATTQQDMSTTVQLQPLQGSGVSGEATVTAMGNQTQVMVRLTGGPANGNHPGHIHSGTCQDIGGVVQALDAISTDAGGSGSMTTTVDVAPMTVMDGQHVIAYHGQGGAPAACGEIPRHTM